MKKRLFPYFLWLLFLGLLGLLVYGFTSHPIMFRHIWSGRELSKLLIFAPIYFLVVGILYFWKAESALLYLLAGFSVILISGLGVGPWFTLGYFFSSSFVLGHRLFGKRDTTSSMMRVLLCILLGSAIYMTLIGTMAHFKINYPFVYAILLFIPFLFPLFSYRKYLGDCQIWILSLRSEKKGEYFSFSLLLFVLIVHLIHIFRPEVGHDALVTHLSVPGYVANHHLWSFDFRSAIWAVMPLGGDWIYTLVYMLGGEFASRLANYTFFVLIILLLYALIQKILPKSVSFLLLAMFASTPFFQLETGSLFVENIWVAFLLAGVMALYQYREHREIRYLYLMSAFLGAALAVKVTSAFLIVPLGIFSLWEIGLTRKQIPPFKTIFLMVGILSIFGLYPYLYAYYQTGNPVFPFMNGIFKSPYTAPVSFNNPIWNQSIHFRTLYDMTFSSHKYLEAQDGVFGFQWLLLLPFSLVFLGKKFSYIGWVALLSGIGFFLGVFHFQSYLRYIFPSLTLFIIVIALCLREVQNINKRLFVCLLGFCFLSTALNIYFMPASGWWHRELPLKLIFDKSSNKKYLKFHAPERNLIAYLNLKYGRHIRVGLFTRSYITGLQGYTITNTWYSEDFSKKIANARSHAEVFSILKNYGLTHFILPFPRGPIKLSPLLRSFFQKYTEREFSCSWVYISHWKKKYTFTIELLKNGDFKKRLKHWTQHGRIKYAKDEGIVQVNSDSTLMQTLAIKDSCSYFYSITARSPAKGTVRIQVNWHNSRGQFLGTTIIPEVCGKKFTTFFAKLNPPSGSTTAIVYVGGHGKDMVEVKSISFKGG